MGTVFPQLLNTFSRLRSICAQQVMAVSLSVLVTHVFFSSVLWSDPADKIMWESSVRVTFLQEPLPDGAENVT